MLVVGTYIADRYEIIGKVGAGGMSDVYKAKDHILGRFVAIKVLKNEFSEDRNFVSKFRSEAQAAAGLEHPNIVNIYDVGSEDGMYYIVMEYVEGITLKTYVEKKGQLSFKEATSIAIQVARGIEAAHNKKITHRDIKPQNIIISTEGKVKVTDFGIAKAASSNTISSDVMGSVHYASPEQARNGFVDGRSDIYSLGIVMFEMVAGRVPFDGDTTVAVAIQHLQDEMPFPSTFASNLPISLEKIILKCTQKNPDRRYQTIAELLSDLRKSLVNPNEDFVILAPLVDNSKTKIIGADELEQIKEKRNSAATSVVVGKAMEEEGQDVGEDLTDDDAEEGLLNPHMDKAITIMSIVVAALIVGLIIFLIGSFFDLFGTRKPAQSGTESQLTESQSESSGVVTVIKLVGMSKEDAEAALEELGLSLFVVATKKSDQPEGTVLEQYTAEGATVERGSTINVVVAGKEDKVYSEEESESEDTETQTEEVAKVEVPDVVGMTEKEAIRALEKLKLKYEKKYEYSDEVEAGRVMSQTPGKGKEVEEGATVTLVISQGQEAVVVPYVVGMDVEEARNKLEELGLDVEIVEQYSDTVPEEQVISQSIEEKKTVAPGTTITIYVSIGQEEKTYSVDKEYSNSSAVAYEFVLVDADGNVLASSNGVVEGDSFSIKLSGLSVSGGSLKITWYGEDADGDGAFDVLNEESKEIEFSEE